MSSGITDGNTFVLDTVKTTLAPVSVAANTTAEQTFTVTTGRNYGTNDSLIDCTKPTAQAGLGICNFRTSAVNQIAVTYVNATAGAIVPTTEVYAMTFLRPESGAPRTV